MKKTIINTQKIHEVEVVGDQIILYTRVKFDDVVYVVESKQLKEQDWFALEQFLANTHNLVVRMMMDNVKGKGPTLTFVDLQAREKPEMEVFNPIRLIDVKLEKLNLIPLKFNDKTVYVQREGFTVLVAPTGGGKTHNAINNLPNLSVNFDKVLYLNLEIPDRDILRRAVQYHRSIENLADNIYLANTIEMKFIEEWAGDDRVCVIVDNIDNLVSTGADAFDAQLNFVSEFDKWSKKKGNLGIFLTQFVKESARESIIKPIEKNGPLQIDPAITFNQLSGVKQISTLSRTVIMTYYDHGNRIGYMKVLKKGSAKFYDELTTEDKSTFVLSVERRSKEITKL